MSTSYPLASRSAGNSNTQVRVGNVEISSNTFTIMAGPCAIESRNQLKEIAEAVKARGAHVVRGGAYKPRTSPYSFQGLESEGLAYLKEISQDLNIPVISEIMDASQLPGMLETVDILQVGTRNMQNFSLLKELGKIKKPVMLKRGMGAKIEELLGAAEYILKGGNDQVILCERGIRTFEDSTRFTLDISAIPVLKKMTHLPIIVDPSHAAGRKDIVESLALAACAAGADGIIVDVHNRPETALCDGAQALSFEEFEEIVNKIKKVWMAVRG